MSRIVRLFVPFSLLILAISLCAQDYEQGTVLKWESKSYSQSAHITRNHIVYSARVGTTIYQIARKSEKVDMTAGQQIKCRAEKNQFFVLNEKDKETKYEIVGTEQVPPTNSPA